MNPVRTSICFSVMVICLCATTATGTVSKNATSNINSGHADRSVTTRYHISSSLSSDTEDRTGTLAKAGRKATGIYATHRKTTAGIHVPSWRQDLWRRKPTTGEKSSYGLFTARYPVVGRRQGANMSRSVQGHRSFVHALGKSRHFDNFLQAATKAKRVSTGHGDNRPDGPADVARSSKKSFPSPRRVRHSQKRVTVGSAKTEHRENEIPPSLSRVDADPAGTFTFVRGLERNVPQELLKNSVVATDKPGNLSHTSADISSSSSRRDTKRVRRGSQAMEILPENYSERQSYFSHTETCRTLTVSRVLRPPGCLPRRVISSACQGTCHSRSVPEWHFEGQEVRQVTYCTCCKPHEMTYRRVRFKCPGRPRKQLVQFVGVADECACRPCSDGNPESQQPYDY